MKRFLLAAAAVHLLFCAASHAQILTYPNPYLDYVYPAGGKQGQTVQVEFGAIGGLDGARSILIDGPPGITVSNVKAINASTVTATFAIAPDAVPGRRFVRVLGGSNGLTNFRYFFVGNMSEALEKESNNALATAQDVAMPVVVNGRIDKDLDIDCYRFHAKSGQRVVAALMAHGMDSIHRASFIQGFVDTSMELLDGQGKVLAAADDTLGLDPVFSHAIKTDGAYVVRIQSLSYKGSPSSVYRLTISDDAYPTVGFPAGAPRGKETGIEISGFNLEKPQRRTLKMPVDGSFPLYYLPPRADRPTAGFDLPLVRGEHDEVVEAEPNHNATSALRVGFPTLINGRIDRAGDEDWYRVALKKGQATVFEVTAQRHLRSPIDTLLELYNTAGLKLGENDDGALFAHPNQCAGDFASADSRLVFTAPADGEYLVRLRDQSGSFGLSAVYRLAIQDANPPFILYQWPDAVPVWGAGTTAAFIVELYHWGLKSDLELRIEGLPKGWVGSSITISHSAFGYLAPNGNRQLLTITAPADAAPGAWAPFRVVGRIRQDGKTIEREAMYLTLYGNSHNDRMFLRHSPGARAVVAGAMDAWPITDVKEITAAHGETVQIPVRFERKKESKRANIGVVVNGPTVAAGCGLGPPVTLAADQDTLMMPLTISPQMPAGTRGVVIARSWSSDIRAGRPGPCTPLILLHVKEKKSP